MRVFKKRIITEVVFAMIELNNEWNVQFLEYT